MTHITCSHTVSSLVFAHLLRAMLGLHDSVIIWKDRAPSNAKNTLAIDTYTHEYLLSEFERRYGQVDWFHDHSSSFAEMKEMFQQLLDSEQAEAEEYSEIITHILHNETSSLSRQLQKVKKSVSSFQLLTSPFAKAGWAQ